MDEVCTHHHQVAILSPVDGGLLSTFEVHKALPARVDVKSSTARDKTVTGSLLGLIFQTGDQ